MRIEFLPSSAECRAIVPPPKPARTYIPDWYSKIPAYTKPMRFDVAGKVRRSVKSCMPFADALRTGWIQETWCDIHISTEEGGLQYHYATDPRPIAHRDMTDDQVTVSRSGYEPVEMTWTTPWIPRMPKGWSILFVSPMNRLDLPFQVMSGVIDADRFHHTPLGQVPFYIHRGFTGLIPAGTPMYQMIPIRRVEMWSSRVLDSTQDEIHRRSHQIDRKFRGAYREEFWQPKRYD